VENMGRIPRILVLFGNVPLLGQERANIEAMDALHQSGFTVEFLIRGEYTQDTIQAELNRRGIPFSKVPFYDTVRRGVTLRVWVRNLFGILGGSLGLLRAIHRFDATHIHVGSPPNFLNFIPALLLTRLPLVFRAGDIPPQHHALWRWVWRFARWRAALFVCDSEFVKRRLVMMGGDPDRMTVLYAPAPRRQKLPDERRTSWVDPSFFTVLYVGQLTQPKGLGLLAEAAVEICRTREHVRFLIAGDYSWNNPFAREIIEAVKKVGLERQIIFLGFVEDIESLYKAADLHVCPSILDEAYGLTVVEAKHHQRPSVVFASGGLLELISDGVDGTVLDQKTSQALQLAIEHYIEHPELLSQHGLEARSSLDRLGVSSFEVKWRQIYQSVTGGSVSRTVVQN